MAEESETVVPPAGDDKKAELATVIAQDFDTTTAIRSLAAAVLRQAKQIDELAAEVVRLGVVVAGLERGASGPRNTRNDAKGAKGGAA